MEFRLGVQSGRIPITSDPSKIKFSEDALEEQSHCVRIADEKVALATQAYDMVFRMSFLACSIQITKIGNGDWRHLS